jgi:hypothetical protein
MGDEDLRQKIAGLEQELRRLEAGAVGSREVRVQSSAFAISELSVPNCFKSISNSVKT